MKSLVEQGMRQSTMAAALDNSTVRNFIFSTLLSVSNSGGGNSSNQQSNDANAV
jgi:hypothetical protein